MLVPTDDERRSLCVRHKWLSRLRRSAHRFGDDEETFLALVEQAQSQLLMRLRLLRELSEMRGDAEQQLKYARFVRSITENDGIWVGEVPSYVELMRQTDTRAPKLGVFEEIEFLVTKHKLDELRSAIARGRQDVTRKQECIVELRDCIQAISTTAKRTAQEINRARNVIGLASESFALLDDSDAAEG